MSASEPTAPPATGQTARTAANPWLLLLPPLAMLVLLGGGLLLAPVMTSGRIPWPPCGMKLAFGAPCPLCGGTHAWAALARGDVAEAFVINPLGAALAFALPLGAIVFMMVVWFQPRVRVNGWWIAGTALALVAANWAYLLLG